MGTSSWSNDFYRDRAVTRSAKNEDLFSHHKATEAKPVAERTVHPRLNPHKVTRESRDSTEHPDSIAIAVILDETGSMANTPREIQAVLPHLMTALIDGGVKDPQVLFGCVGDETNHEVASCQIGQFESGLEMEDNLGDMFMEGHGGGTNEESYQNVLYFFARHTSCDCFEKRGRKGFLFIVGDEMAYPIVKRNEVEKLFGDNLQDNIPLETIVAECQAKNEIYFIIPRHTNNGSSPAIFGYWEKLLGKGHVIRADDAAAVCTTVVNAVKGSTVPAPVDDTGNVRL